MRPAHLVSEVNYNEYISCMPRNEVDPSALAFNEWFSEQGFNTYTKEFINIRFVEFIEEIYMYTYCDVCGSHYHKEDPCLFH